MNSMKRPLGITILSIAHIIFGGLTVLMALFTALFLLIDIPPDIINDGFDGIPTKGLGMAFNTTILFTIGAIVLVTGIGLIEGWGWIWYVEIFLMISLILNIIFLSVSTLSPIFVLIFPLVILYYLYRPYVKDYFFGYGDSDIDETL